MNEVEPDYFVAELAAVEERGRQLEQTRHVPRCETCRHYLPSIDEENRTLDRGTCRRFPPSRTFGALDGFEFSPTLPQCWCGEHQAADPATADQAAEALARAVLRGDATAARALADKVMEMDAPRE